MDAQQISPRLFFSVSVFFSLIVCVVGKRVRDSGGFTREGLEKRLEAALNAEAHQVLLGNVRLVAGSFEPVVEIAGNAEGDIDEFSLGGRFCGDGGVGHAGTI